MAKVGVPKAKEVGPTKAKGVGTKKAKEKERKGRRKRQFTTSQQISEKSRPRNFRRPGSYLGLLVMV